jgi:hypothetical protein
VCTNPLIEIPAAVLILFIVALIVRDRSRESPQRPLHPTDAELSNNLEQVKLLFEYTKFHITVYGSIAALLLTASTSIGNSLHLHREYVVAAVCAILVAGLAAGVVAASMPGSTDLIGFWDELGGPYKFRVMTIRSWTFVEHTFFWTAVFFVVLAFVYADHAASHGFEITLTYK